MICIIAGPTAIGKTKVAIETAKKINGEVISADSMQIYKGFNIGTAKPTTEEMEGIPHHLISITEPHENFSAGEFVFRTNVLIKEIIKNGKIPIIAGGTGFYVNALMTGVDVSETIGEENLKRDEFMKMAEEKGAEYIHSILQKKDPEYAALTHFNNVKRVARALGYIEVNNQTFTSYNECLKKRQTDEKYRLFKLSLPRDVLYERINSRTEKMYEDGLVNEVKGLLGSGVDKTLAPMNGIGYKEVVKYLDGFYSLDEAIEKTKQATRNYAKRQETWFNNKMDGIKIDVRNLTNCIIPF